MSLHASLQDEGQLRTKNDKNLCWRKSYDENDGASRAWKFVSGEEEGWLKVFRSRESRDAFSPHAASLVPTVDPGPGPRTTLELDLTLHSPSGKSENFRSVPLLRGQVFFTQNDSWDPTDAFGTGRRPQKVSVHKYNDRRSSVHTNACILYARSIGISTAGGR